MNKGKRSIQVDLRSPVGQDLIATLIARPGPDRGIFLTNFPTRGALSYDALKARRSDVIMVALTGNADGTSEVDYTVNVATGFPEITGPRDASEPVNSVLPAWDIAMGEMAAVGVLAADRHRSRTGMGSLVKLALSDVALAMVANLGRLGQAELGHGAKKDGNYLYGAFGRDFVTSDGRRVMVMALTERQWKALAAGDRDRRDSARCCNRRRPRHRGWALRGARRDRRGARSLVRCTKLRRGAAHFRKRRRVMGTLPDLPAARGGRSAMLHA